MYTPGRDRPPTTGSTSALYSPARGAGGIFAEYLQGFTPKYAKNEGYRSDLFRNTLARLFVRVDASEMNLFLASIPDEHTKTRLAPRLTGTPVTQQRNRTSGGAGSRDASVRANQSYATNGYLDFFIQDASLPLQEIVDVKSTLSGNYVAYFFGQAPPVWSFTGWLLNTVQDDQATNFMRLYLEIMRGTRLAQRQKVLSLKIDSYIITGAMTSVNFALKSASEIYVPFAFQMLVKRIDIVNYTHGWVPTRASTPFAADPNAIPYDGRPRSAGAQLAIAARLPPNTQEVSPAPDRSADPRTQEAPVLTDVMSAAPWLLQQPAATPSLVEQLANGLPGLAQSGTVQVPLRAPQDPLAPIYRPNAPETVNYTPAPDILMSL